MPSKKKRYNARFPAGRIKKIMQTDEEVGKVAQAVPIIISRTLELFVESLITKSMQITLTKNARTLAPHHMKQCILSESRFDFLRDLVKSVPEGATSDDDNWAPNESSARPQTERRVSCDDFLDKVDKDEKSNESRQEDEKDTTATVGSAGLNFYMETSNLTSNGTKHRRDSLVINTSPSVECDSDSDS